MQQYNFFLLEFPPNFLRLHASGNNRDDSNLLVVIMLYLYL